MSDLTERQQAVLDAIKRHVKPIAAVTVRELCNEFGLTTNAIHQHIVALERKGEIVRRPGRTGIEVVTHEVSE